MTLVGLPESFPCGTRAAYVRGCRCAACKRANVDAYHERQARALEALEGFTAPARVPVLEQLGAAAAPPRKRKASAMCPGLEGACPTRSGIKANSKGGICHACRARLVWNGLVDASRVRHRLEWLSDWGIGYKAAADAAGVARSVVAKIKSGRRTMVRRETRDKLFAVTTGQLADHAIIDGKSTWDHLRFMLARGLTRTEIARRLGSESATPALQLKRNVLAITALRVAKLRAKVEAERATLSLGRGGLKCPECETGHKPAERRAVIARMLPAPAAEVLECWACMYVGAEGARLLAEDLAAIKAGRS